MNDTTEIHTFYLQFYIGDEIVEVTTKARVLEYSPCRPGLPLFVTQCAHKVYNLTTRKMLKDRYREVYFNLSAHQAFQLALHPHVDIDIITNMVHSNDREPLPPDLLGQ